MNHARMYRLNLTALVVLAATGCSTVPQTSGDRTTLHRECVAAFNEFRKTDQTLVSFLGHAYGYAIFPSIGKGAIVFGGAYGNGEVYEQGTRIGYADISQYTFGLALGGQEYSELVIFANKPTLEAFEAGRTAFSANCSGVAISSGLGATLKYDDGVVAVVDPKAGLMAEADLGGQTFNYKPLNSPTSSP